MGMDRRGVNEVWVWSVCLLGRLCGGYVWALGMVGWVGLVVVFQKVMSGGVAEVEGELPSCGIVWIWGVGAVWENPKNLRVCLISSGRRRIGSMPLGLGWVVAR